MSTSRSSFTSIYDSLPQDAQQSLVHQHLIPLLKGASKRKQRRVLTATTRIHQRHATVPELDLRGKKLEINNMLKELSKDTKRSYVMDSSNRNELLDEIVSSVASWMNPIWSAVYEHHVDFAQAHDCLLFVSATLDRLDTIRMGCKCTLNTMYVPVTLRDKKGDIVREFELNGVIRLEDVALFIWRDLFLCILAYGDKRHKNMIPRMLGDIEQVMGWKGVIRMFYARSKGDKHRSDNTDYESDWEDASSADEDSMPGLDDVSDSEGSQLPDPAAPVNFDLPHMPHWPPPVAQNAALLARHVKKVLISAFEASPSCNLYMALIGLSRHRLRKRLFEVLQAMAPTSSDTFAVALEIYTMNKRFDLVLDLLDLHSHLLRPRDYPTLQAAAKLLSGHSLASRALRILEDELLDTAHATRHALLQSFSQMETPASREELLRIMKMRSSAPGRRARVEAWVDAAMTPGADQPNPMIFAAMMMGIGPVPGLSPDDDPYTYLDLDPNDPDLADLRAEYRPDLKKRFESWVDTGVVLQNGPASLLAVFQKIVEMMPFLRASDVTEEMISRIQDRASKQFACDGLDALLAFVKVQKRKLHHLRQEQKKREARAAAEAKTTAELAHPIASSSSSQTPTMPYPSMSSMGTQTSQSELPDLVDRADSPGPPPLIPVPGYEPPQHPHHAPQPPTHLHPLQAFFGPYPPPDPNAPPNAPQMDLHADAPPPQQPPQQEFHVPTGLLAMLAGMLGGPAPPAPAPAPAPGPPDNHGGGGSVDDVD